MRLDNNPIEKPPLEIVEKGVEAIKEYFRQLEAEGVDYLYEAKLQEQFASARIAC